MPVSFALQHLFMYIHHWGESRVRQALFVEFPKLHYSLSKLHNDSRWLLDSYCDVCNSMLKPVYEQSTSLQLQIWSLFTCLWLWHEGQGCDSAPRVSFWRRVIKPGVILHSLCIYSLWWQQCWKSTEFYAAVNGTKANSMRKRLQEIVWQMSMVQAVPNTSKLTATY